MHWSLTQQVATLQIGAWQWLFDLAQPRSGVQVGPRAGGPAAQLLQVVPSPQHACQIEDSFARGSDLMVRYGQSESDSFAFQLDFRAVPRDALGPFECGLDLWLSVQTQLLDSHPTLEVRSEVAGARWSATDSDGRPAASDALAALSCRASSVAVAIFIHPSDRCQAELLSATEATSSRVRLFGNFMEKGVIRRGRVRCLLGHADIDQRALSAAYASFAASPLPLTT